MTQTARRFSGDREGTRGGWEHTHFENQEAGRVAWTHHSHLSWGNGLTHRDVWLPLFEVAGWQIGRRVRDDDSFPVVAPHYWGGLLLCRYHMLALLLLYFLLRRYPLIVYIGWLALAAFTPLSSAGGSLNYYPFHTGTWGWCFCDSFGKAWIEIIFCSRTRIPSLGITGASGVTNVYYGSIGASSF